METPSPKPPRLDVLQPVPSPALRRVQPLRIVKRRSTSSCGGAEGYNGDRGARKCSHETDESRGSAPDPPGSETQLTVPKIRGNRSSQLFDGLDDVHEEPAALGREHEAPRGACFPSGHDVNNLLMMKGYPEPHAESPMPGAWPLLHDSRHLPTEREPQFMGSFRSRCSPRLRGNNFARSALGFRDQLVLLESPQLGSSRGRPHMPGAVHHAPLQLFSPLSLEDHQAPSNGASPYSPRQYECDSRPPALLVPDVCVTAELRVVGSGYHNFWVAIEVTARSHVPDQNDVDAADFSGARSLYSSHAADFGTIVRLPKTTLAFG